MAEAEIQETLLKYSEPQELGADDEEGVGSLRMSKKSPAGSTRTSLRRVSQAEATDGRQALN